MKVFHGITATRGRALSLAENGAALGESRMQLGRSGAAMNMRYAYLVECALVSGHEVISAKIDMG